MKYNTFITAEKTNTLAIIVARLDVISYTSNGLIGKFKAIYCYNIDDR